MTLERDVEKASFEELRHILRWMDERNGTTEGDPGVLIGGWAVYAYRPYLGSIDVDLVMSRAMRKSLSHWLIENRGFEPTRTQEPGWEGVRKRVGRAWVVADFGNRHEVYRFEGHVDAALPFSILDGRTARREIQGVKVVVPERSLLILFKLKAAHDRGTRLKEGRSHDPAWERSKRVKDLADVLALLDSGRHDLSVGFLGEQLHRFPFLVAQLRAAGTDPDAVGRYAGLGEADARALVDRTLSLVT